MASKSKIVCESLFFLVFILGACSKHRGAEEAPYLFSGSCSVEVLSKTEGAEILVDGIPVGEDHVKVSIPCGEKMIMVKKAGYISYQHFLPVSVKEPLKVTVELEKTKKVKNFALSAELVEMVRLGKKIIDPWASPSDAIAAKKEVDAHPQGLATDSSMPTPSLSPKAVEENGGAPSSPSAGGPLTVEDWR